MSARHTFVALAGLAFAGQLCAVAYEIAVAGSFGTGIDADALAFSLTLALALANEVVTWVTTLFIPKYLEAQTRGGPAAAAGFFRHTVVLLGGATAAGAALLVIVAPALVALLAPTLAPGRAAATLLRLFAPLFVLLPLSALLGGTLQAHGRFIIASLRQLFWYGVALAAIGLGGSRLGVAAVPVGMVLGLLLFCGLLAASRPSDTAMRGSPPEHARIGHLVWSLGPLALASAVNYVNVTVERAIAGRLGEGSLAALTYAFRLLNVPVSLFLMNAATMLFPSLAAHAARDDTRELGALVRRALRLALVFTVPVAALAAALAQPAIRLLLERGAFTPESTRLTASALAWYAPALVGMAGVQVLLRAYQALQAIGRMVAVGVTVVTLNLALMPLLTAVLGFRGLPLAISISTVVLFIAMLIGLRSRLPELALGDLLGSAERTVLAGAVAVAAVWIARLWIARVMGDVGPLAELAVAGGAGVLGYGLMLCGVARDDVRLALGFVAPRLAHRLADRP